MELRFGGARYSAMTAIGYGLDGIGELDGVDLTRAEAEPDQRYRERLIAKLNWLCCFSKPVEIADMDGFSEYQLWLEKSTPVEIDGLKYFVQQVSYENGRFGAWLMPAVPLQLVDHEWRGPMGTQTTAPATEPKPNHVRDAVRANQ